MVIPSVTETLRHGATRPHTETVRPLRDPHDDAVHRLRQATSA